MEQRRAMIGKREDRRVRRTKRILEEGLFELLTRKPIKDITVRELTELVDINRGTFYLYYCDVYDMLEKIEDEYYTRFQNLILEHEKETPSEQHKSIFLTLFTFVAQNKKLCTVLIRQDRDPAFLQRLNDFLRTHYRKEWEKDGNPEIDEVTFEYLFSYVTLGAMGVMRNWLMRDCQESPEMMAQLTERLIWDERWLREGSRRHTEGI